MSELAGRVGDGVITPAGNSRLADLLGAARAARADADRAGGPPFVVVATAGLSAEWLDRDGARRARLVELGVDRLALFAGPPLRASVEFAGRYART
jgi:hypothetical protein